MPSRNYPFNDYPHQDYPYQDYPYLQESATTPQRPGTRKRPNAGKDHVQHPNLLFSLFRLAFVICWTFTIAVFRIVIWLFSLLFERRANFPENHRDLSAAPRGFGNKSAATRHKRSRHRC
jgi:hypothetical protein